MSVEMPRSRLGRGLSDLLSSPQQPWPRLLHSGRVRSAQMLRYLNEPDADQYYVAILGDYRAHDFVQTVEKLKEVHGDRLCLRFLSEEFAPDGPWVGLWNAAGLLGLRMEHWKITDSALSSTTLAFARGHPYQWLCTVRCRQSTNFEPTWEVRQEMVNISDAVMFDRERYLFDRIWTGKNPQHYADKYGEPAAELTHAY